MFTTEMSEMKENVVTISDIEFEVMQELIRYIYTDQVENFELAAPLLVAADYVIFSNVQLSIHKFNYIMNQFQYNLETMVGECKSFLISNLTNENFFDATRVANQLNLDDLMIACKMFFKK
jgi:hypothetical protein